MHRTIRAGLGLVLLGGLLGLAGCTPPPPEVIQVTTTADVVADDDLTSLREAFARANARPNDNVIELVAGEEVTYELTNCAAGPLVHTTASTLTVAGSTTITQTCPDTGIMVSTVPASTLSLVYVTLTGGPNTGVTVPGAGINVRGKLTLGMATVTGVNAGPGGTVIDGNGGGPAETDIFVDFSTISGNTGTAISIGDGAVEVTFSSVSDNAGDGIRLLGVSRYESAYSSVYGNTGWGLDVRGTGDSRVQIMDGAVSANRSGGISCTGCLRLYVDAVSVSDNGAGAVEGSGGGVAFTAVSGQTFERPTLQMYYSQVTGNRARRAGGGIFAEGSPSSMGPSVSAFDVRISGNRTIGDGRHGGGIAVTAGALSIGYTEIFDNVAGGSGSDGGGVYLREPDGPNWFPTTFDMYEDILSGNRAGGNGGAIAVETDGGITMTRSDLVGNVAAGTGGGARIVGGATVDSMHVRSNQGSDGGGAFIAAPDRTTDVRVSGSTFEANTATGRGGGLAANGVRSLHVVNSTLVDNVASRSGGGIAMLDDPPGGSEKLDLHFSTLTGNSAALGANVASEVRLESYGAVVVEPRGGGANCAVDPGDRYPWGYSFLSDVTCGSHPLDLISTDDPQLGPLTPDPDLPPIRTPAPTSPIAGLVPVAACDVDDDQRLTTRPQGDACEAGSVEIAEAAAGDARSPSLARG